MLCSLFFFFNDTATTEIYTLSLHDALPICVHIVLATAGVAAGLLAMRGARAWKWWVLGSGLVFLSLRSEEHTSELQSLRHLVCRLLLEKKKIVTRSRW